MARKEGGHKCAMCGETFTTVEELEKHKKEHKKKG